LTDKYQFQKQAKTMDQLAVIWFNNEHRDRKPDSWWHRLWMLPFMSF